MNATNNNAPMMYQTNQAVAVLNKVPNFDPLRFLRKCVSPLTHEEVLKLDARYKRLWFRLAYPQGRLMVNALRITEQMAIFEAKVFLDRKDTDPVSTWTTSCKASTTPGGLYIEAAQEDALDHALTNAGFGIQFVDVSVGKKGEPYGSEIPAQAVPVIATPPAVPVQGATPAAEVQQAKPAVAEAVQAEPEKVKPKPAPQRAVMVDDDDAPVAKPAPMEPVNAAEQTVAPPAPAVQEAVIEQAEQPAVEQAAAAESVEKTAEPVQEAAQPRYTADMTVDEIRALMTFEEARELRVTEGTCRGWTLEQVADRRAPSLKWYAYSASKVDNILRAGSLVMLDWLESQKAA